nr:relaxin receptor 1-like [Penaeus vannamei]
MSLIRPLRKDPGRTTGNRAMSLILFLIIIDGRDPCGRDGAFARASFSSMGEIEEIHLTGNNLGALENGTLDGTRSLSHLQLSSNNITSIPDGFFHQNVRLTRLELNDNSLTEIRPAMFHGLVSLLNLYIERNRMEHLPRGVFSAMPRLQFLYLGANRLRTLDPGAFVGLFYLHLLSLERNQLRSLDNGTFEGLESVKTLILQDNGLEAFEPGTFGDLVSVESLCLKGNGLSELPEGDVFGEMTKLQYIYFDEFRQCSLALHVRQCEPKGDGISSVEHLLDSIVLRICVWVMGLLACAGNILVLVGRYVVKEPNRVHSFYIKNLSLSDLLMGVYLFIIAFYDASFRGTYIRHETSWRRSWQCSFCGEAIEIDGMNEQIILPQHPQFEASVLTLTTITLDRYCSIVHPLTLKERTFRAAAGVMATIWTLAALLALLPVVGLAYYGDNFYGSNGMCLPLHIHDVCEAAACEYCLRLPLATSACDYHLRLPFASTICNYHLRHLQLPFATTTCAYHLRLLLAPTICPLAALPLETTTCAYHLRLPLSKGKHTRLQLRGSCAQEIIKETARGFRASAESEPTTPTKSNSTKTKTSSFVEPTTEPKQRAVQVLGFQKV